MPWAIIVATTFIALTVFAGDVTARNHAAVEAEVSKALADVRRASLDADIDALERLLADDFTFIDASGQLVRKHEVIDAFLKKVAVIQSWTYDRVSIRVYETFAVATGISELQQRAMNKDTSGRFRFTRVFVKEGGQWRSVAMQATRI
jgi:ketosteroid isomerase-like protein